MQNLNYFVMEIFVFLIKKNIYFEQLIPYIYKNGYK